jgi:hypothetical protein
MIVLVDTVPDVNVQAAEYKRVLGFPRERVLSGRARELTEWARAWYAKHGKPWVYARQIDGVQITNGSVCIDGETFVSKPLRKALLDAEADSVIVAAVSAGPEVADEAHRLWVEEKPDEYFFLEIFGSAVVEHLVTMTGARLCAWAEGRGLAVLPHYSPGYPDWDISEQGKLLDLIRRTTGHSMPAELSVMESGMLRPKKSLLAVFGLTSKTEKVRKLTELVPCQNCSLAGCQYRRVPYSRVSIRSEVEAAPDSEEVIEEVVPETPRLDRAAKYSANAKALRRWGDERLKLTFNDDGTIDAAFRYEGTTCRNMGRTILFDYRVKLGPREEGYVIREQFSGPAPGDEGYTHMCRYMSNPEHLMVAIDHEKPLLGQPLNDVITWQRATNNAGCYCEPASRKHKWGLVLETIHYALVQRENAHATAAVAAVPASITVVPLGIRAPEGRQNVAHGVSRG